MPEYLIEIPHSPEECPPDGRATSRGDRTAQWTTYLGCRSGTHTSWTIAELPGSDEAWALVPELLQDTARVVLVERSEPSASRRRTARSFRGQLEPPNGVTAVVASSLRPPPILTSMATRPKGEQR